MKLNRNHVFLALGLSLAGASIFPIKTLYQRHKANVLIEQTENELGQLERKINSAQECAQHNAFLTPAEREGVQQEIGHAKEKLPSIRWQLGTLRGVFDTKEYQRVRDGLDPSFQAVEAKTTPLSEAQQENAHLVQQLGLCKDKQDLRNAVLSNELFLKARLKKPEAIGLELSEDLALLGENLRKYVPPLTLELQQALSQLDSNLYNSLGANLIQHQAPLNHALQFGRTPAVQQTAQGFYDTALGAYVQVKPVNDKLPVWYRPSKDGTFDKGQYEGLLAQQKPVVELIRRGDNQLQSLNRYLEELHEQHWIYVADHTEHGTSKLSYSLNKNKLVTIDGYRFGYVLRTETPTGHHDEEITVGTRYEDEFGCGFLGCSWSYGSDEEVGYVREWKRLHYDRKNMPHGTGLNPHFETEPK